MPDVGKVWTGAAAQEGPVGLSAVTTPHEPDLDDWHTLLLRLAGALPDELISEARTWLAAGGQTDVAQAIGFAAAAAHVPVLARDAELIARQLRAAGQDAQLTESLEVVEEAGNFCGPWVFGPMDPSRAGDPVGPLDLTGASGRHAMDAVDQAISVAAGQEEDLTAVWRVWRAPAEGSPWPPPRRMFVVQADARVSGRHLIEVTARLQGALAAAGERNPQVEVCSPRWPVPGYQSSASAQGALIWAAEPATPVRLARTFDEVDAEDGPRFAEDHPVIEDLEELTRLLRYLGHGLPVLTTSATMTDILDPERPDVVPLSFRTDGQWVWTDTVTFYLENYGLAPEPDLLAHLRRSGEEGPEVSDVAVHRVLSLLQGEGGDEPVWTVPQRDA
ncbi:hypothetical protein LWF15_25070 [Kineosporia rhizophila]|uniref:hypothetical protein n=1 Tax=Kineosporia rhizophila TaxID=84633 RepID=UPI001E5ABEFE|nr:hypothetical protein [Kineosporia rhizophila]MCE0538776.1 hypothetical protein [Kineosporia rhizophila]